MTDTTKLACTFKAWRLVIGLDPNQLGVVIKRCLDLGLKPKPCGYQDDWVLVSVTIPCGVCNSPVQDFTQKWLKPFHAAVVHGTTVELICPLPQPAA